MAGVRCYVLDGNNLYDCAAAVNGAEIGSGPTISLSIRANHDEGVQKVRFWEARIITLCKASNV